MSFAVFGDLHFGVNEQHPLFQEYQIKNFLNSVNIARNKRCSTLIYLGDLVDNRTEISIPTLNIIKSMLYPKDFNIIVIAGNHDVYYNNINGVNSIEILSSFFKNVTTIIDKPQTVVIDGHNCLFVPWINESNHDDSIELITNSKAKYCFCHADIIGGTMVNGIRCKNGLKPSLFKHFKQVFSGHFHIKSQIDNIHYVGSNSQLDWNDYSDEKRIFVVDCDNIEEKLVEEDQIFKKIVIDDSFSFKSDMDKYEGKFLKIYINRKLSNKESLSLEKLIESAIKFEVIDNTILDLSSEIEIKDEGFEELIDGLDVLIEQENIDKKLTSAIKELILNTKREIDSGVI